MNDDGRCIDMKKITADDKKYSGVKQNKINWWSMSKIL